MNTFETGLHTHAANDVALTISNEGDVYNLFCRFSSAGYHALARRIVSEACERYGSHEYGRSWQDEDHAAVIAYVVDGWAESLA